MTGPSVDIFKQTIAGYSLASILSLMPKTKRPAGEEILKRIWMVVGIATSQQSPPVVRTAPDALPEIRHTDKIEIKKVDEDFAEVSEIKWSDLRIELFKSGLDEDAVRLIAKDLATGKTAHHVGEGALHYEYRKVQANG